MKKDRACGGATPYPVYPTPMMNPMPPMNTPFMMPMQPMGTMQSISYPNYAQGVQSNPNLEQQVSNLANQISNLERRVTALEGTVGTPNYSNYNTSNYQMM